MRGSTRRTFLGVGAALSLVPLPSVGRMTSRETVGIGVIGLNGRGRDLARGFSRAEGSRVVAVCDVDDATIAPALESVGSGAPRVEKDFRRLLDDREIDAVAIATPDHWHALMTILACQAGKDVYVEKPASHNVIEGRRMVEAARKHGRVVQVGTQRRSAPHVVEAVEHLKSGGVGKVGLARAWIHQKRQPVAPALPAEVPPGLDWALWQGPAPLRPYVTNRVHYNWHWYWHWATGELGNNGVHGVDVARWGLGVDAPRRVTSGGGVYVLTDGRETPDTQVATWDFGDCAISYEHRMWSKHGLEGGSYFGIAFYGENGTLIIDDDGWRVEDGPKASGPPRDGQAAHFANFLECVATRKTPNADIEIGHSSTRLCHLGNIAQRLGKTLDFDAANESFPNDEAANALLGREYSEAFSLPSV